MYMYSEHNSRPSRRVNDEFLRRMVGGELTQKALPVMNTVPTELARGQNTGNSACNQNDDEGNGCPTNIGAPSLAMVYAPRQCWRNLLDHEAALLNGSLFAELVMPFEGDRKSGEIGGKLCK